MSPPGYLWVLSEPGQTATEEEFQDWYDNEHVPLRMNHIREFLTGARYKAADGQRPGWSASYDIESIDLFTDNKYTKLRANRSKREGELVVRLETLDRRTCETLAQTGPPPKAEDTPQFMLTVLERGDADHAALNVFQGVKGWRRSHMHKVYDSLHTGSGKEPKQNEANGTAVIHEFDDESYVDSEAYQTATAGKTEVRRWQLRQAFPNTASA